MWSFLEEHKYEVIMTNEAGSLTVKAVLIVEDDQGIGSFILHTNLNKTSHHAILVNDGHRAIETVKNIVPNLFVLDYHLPFMNGIELYDRLHARKELEHVPALLMSAHLLKGEAKKRKITCLEKPFELDDLLKIIMISLRNQDSQQYLNIRHHMTNHTTMPYQILCNST
jgi:DNA-binding response OmpR family regulator